MPATSSLCCLDQPSGAADAAPVAGLFWGLVELTGQGWLPDA